MRALETAAEITKASGAPITTVDELTDMNFGSWEGTALREVEERFPDELAVWQKTPDKYYALNGEGLENVRHRVAKALTKIPSDAQGSFVVVTHRVLCKALVLHALGISNKHFWDLRFDTASISLLEKTGNSTSLSFLNDICHLKSDSVIRQCRDF